jgi:hypothetical protein
MTPLLGVLFIPYRTSIIHPTLWHCTRKHRHRRFTHLEAGAKSGRSEHWKRSNPPLAHGAKAPPCPSLPASAGLVPRSPCNDNRRVESVPFCVNRWDRPPRAIRAERCRAGASLGCEHHHPSRKARKLILPRAYSASGGPIPRVRDGVKTD